MRQAADVPPKYVADARMGKSRKKSDAHTYIRTARDNGLMTLREPGVLSNH